MKKRILILGDSYTYGHGCSDRVYYWDEEKKEQVGWFFKYPTDGPSRFCWATLLQQDLPDYDVVNLARPGNSNQHAFGQLMDYLYNFKEHVDLVVFNATFVDRVEAAAQSEPERADPWCIMHEHKDGREEDWYKQAKLGYIKHLYNGTIGIHQTMSAIFGAHSLVKNNGIKFLWSVPPVALPVPLRKHFAPIRLSQMKHIHHFDFSTKNDKEFNRTCLCPDWHTNDKGHKLYYVMEAAPRIKYVLQNEQQKEIPDSQ